MKKEDFIEAYAKFVLQGNAGLFLGAGLSMGAGYPSWRKLVEDMAKEINLDVEVETDLVGLVQFALNKAGRTRTRLVRLITDHFGEEKPIPAIFRTLARLPIARIWTTNYDTLAERAWRAQRKRLDVKSFNKDVMSENPWAHATLYKMHGTVDHPSEVVISKGDYEEYRRKRASFLHLLTGQIISHHMLFIGLSFTDPNLQYLFMMIREAFEDTPPEHFSIVRKPKRNEHKTKRLYDYAVNRHNLWVDDLKNYGIQCVEVDEYDEVDSLVEAVERRIAMGSIMVSGSFPDTLLPDDLEKRRRIETVAHGVGRLIAERNRRLVSGFGLVVGSAALSGALDQFNKQELPNFEKSLFLRPFPQIIPDGVDRQTYYKAYREDLSKQAGACVFISGEKDESGKRITANGVISEFEISTGARRFPIPVGATGGASQAIWKIVEEDYKRYLGKLPKKLFNALNETSYTSSQLIASVAAVLDWLLEHDAHT